ncbi:hypothetical protein OG21DRAFT_1268883 [Imleria badia]|nr:hypothetical protein OG21DRAFT_1268883 [Imleria badia]
MSSPASCDAMHGLRTIVSYSITSTFLAHLTAFDIQARETVYILRGPDIASAFRHGAWSRIPSPRWSQSCVFQARNINAPVHHRVNTLDMVAKPSEPPDFRVVYPTSSAPTSSVLNPCGSACHDPPNIHIFRSFYLPIFPVYQSSRSDKTMHSTITGKLFIPVCVGWRRLICSRSVHSTSSQWFSDHRDAATFGARLLTSVPRFRNR